FFFASGRRHTSFSRDWSSDVCSSDLDSSQGPRWQGPGVAHVHEGFWEVIVLLYSSAATCQVRTSLKPPPSPAGPSHLASPPKNRSEARRVGKGRRARWSRDQYRSTQS